jgi:transposase InsO family protein
MARGVVAMDVRMRIAVASAGVNVAAFCRDHGISRQTFYVWRRRYEREGQSGLEPRSRVPRRNPHWVGAELEDAIVVLRKELEALSVDAGPATIRWHLGRRRPRGRVPSEATIWRVLVRHGHIVPAPGKRSRASYRRFEASVPNELWQADCMDWAAVKILSFLDDHSRVALRVKAIEHATSDATWDTFSEAAARWGVPLGQLTDNGVNFSGKLRGFEVRFETELRAIGVVPKTSRPFHPQTCGKVERFQQTLKKWLRGQPPAAELADLQAQLDWFVDYYNEQRPHRGIGRVTPAERWAATPPAINLGQPLPRPELRSTVTVAANGNINAGGYRVNLGVAWAGRTAHLHRDDAHLAVFIDHRLVRALTLEPGRTYYGVTNPH